MSDVAKCGCPQSIWDGLTDSYTRDRNVWENVRICADQSRRGVMPEVAAAAKAWDVTAVVDGIAKFVTSNSAEVVGQAARKFSDCNSAVQQAQQQLNILEEATQYSGLQ